jgi:hypothetical protein
MPKDASHHTGCDLPCWLGAWFMVDAILFAAGEY